IHEYGIFHSRDDFCCDAATDEYAAVGHKIQCAISRLRSIDADENIQSLIANCRLLFKGKLRNQGGLIRRFGHLLLQPLGFFGLSGIAKKIVDVFDAGTGKDSLATYVVILLAEILCHFRFQVILGSKVGMTTFAREWMVTESIPIETGDSEPSARGDHDPVAFRILDSITQRDEVFGLERVDSIGVSLQIIDEADRAELELSGQFARVNRPGKI